MNVVSIAIEDFTSDMRAMLQAVHFLQCLGPPFGRRGRPAGTAARVVEKLALPPTLAVALLKVVARSPAAAAAASAGTGARAGGCGRVGAEPPRSLNRKKRRKKKEAVRRHEERELGRSKGPSARAANARRIAARLIPGGAFGIWWRVWCWREHACIHRCSQTPLARPTPGA